MMASLKELLTPNDQQRRRNEEFMVEARARMAETNAYIGRIERAVEEAGFSPNALFDLPPGYIAAALALGVK